MNNNSLNKSNTKTYEKFFEKIRHNIIGYNHTFLTPYGEKRLLYADWTASGRLYKPIEDKISYLMGPFVGNTHTETNITGTSMTLAYQKAKQIIKKHVNASENDALISTGSGMTGAILKLQRMLGYKVPSRLTNRINIHEKEQPIVFVTHMEHHSNQTSWYETIAKVEIIEPDSQGLVNIEHLQFLLEKYRDYPNKIASITSCSNVTGIFTPYHQIAEMMHSYGGLCFVDFACSAPYINIDMHPVNPKQKLDAIFFSPHKFLGGPGSAGIVIFDKSLYHTGGSPDQPGGGTVKWTNPWGQHAFYEDVELREDGGTPPFLQTIKTALCIKLKEDMNSEIMMKREHLIAEKMFKALRAIPNLHLLANNIEDRLALFSFYIDDLHYNLGVKLLNDRFGIQVRGGCSCAGTYGHYLLHVSKHQSQMITRMIDNDDLSLKPGWIRISLHPVMADSEVEYVIKAVEELAANHKEWRKDYIYDKRSNYFIHKSYKNAEEDLVNEWFKML